MSDYNDQYSQQRVGQPSPAEGGAGAPVPVRVTLPSSTPYVTYAIIGITSVVFLLQIISVLLFGYYGSITRPSLQDVLSGFFAGTNQVDWLIVFGGQIGELIRQGQVWRLLTPMLLHVSLWHIGFNMYALWVFGVGQERAFGHWRFLLLYVLAGFSGNVLSFLHTAGPSVGASTSIFGLLGAEGIFLYQNRKLFGQRYGALIGNIIFVAAVNLFVIGRFAGVDNWGHIGGLMGGLIFTLFGGPIWEIRGMSLSPYVADTRELRGVITGAAAVIVIFGALAVWGMVGPLIP